MKTDNYACLELMNSLKFWKIHIFLFQLDDLDDWIKTLNVYSIYNGFTYSNPLACTHKDWKWWSGESRSVQSASPVDTWPVHFSWPRDTTLVKRSVCLLGKQQLTICVSAPLLSVCFTSQSREKHTTREYSAGFKLLTYSTSELTLCSLWFYLNWVCIQISGPSEAE